MNTLLLWLFQAVMFLAPVAFLAILISAVLWLVKKHKNSTTQVNPQPELPAQKRNGKQILKDMGKSAIWALSATILSVVALFYLTGIFYPEAGLATIIYFFAAPAYFVVAFVLDSVMHCFIFWRKWPSFLRVMILLALIVISSILLTW